ncbi:hypothetical protein R1flu_009911 [Riccia fluitans]|uniref:Aminopeptidase N n=1 Tax=Riccia fluitans TaxID=41844 RepID=A0ABD1Z4L3_9MARC
MATRDRSGVPRSAYGLPAKSIHWSGWTERPVVGWATSIGTHLCRPRAIVSAVPVGIKRSTAVHSPQGPVRLKFSGAFQRAARTLSSTVLKGRVCHFGTARCTAAAPAQPSSTAASTMKETPKEIFLKDYRAPAFLFDEVNLKFVLGEQFTTVLSTIKVLPKSNGPNTPLTLDGEDLKLLHIKIDERQLQANEFELVGRKLVLKSPPTNPFVLEIATEIQPQNNTSLEGLYKSTGMFCTQCEAEGFRKITYYQDRPDVMAKFTTRIEADKELYPVLLSNGNLIDQGTLEGGKHYAVWEDPFKKPSYLFALVAGQLVSRDDTFKTMSGREVALRIWTPADDIRKTGHAMTSLKAAMKWDEDVFGLEYDLDLFNIVAVPDFNMGAMENKSLNIFNSKLVLASPETATDSDYASIEGVIGHEYFHNWTGNRVTCRDWFQLSLKEGLTVFRDQEFSSDMGSRAVKRIADVIRLRISQFPQDAGPMSHPVRPHSYIKMDNFYTVTVSTCQFYAPHTGQAYKLQFWYF